MHIAALKAHTVKKICRFLLFALVNWGHRKKGEKQKTGEIIDLCTVIMWGHRKRQTFFTVQNGCSCSIPCIEVFSVFFYFTYSTTDRC